MESNVLTRLNRVAARQTVTLTHYGRKSGKPYDVTIRFVVEGDKVYIGTANVNRQWVRNVQKTPQVKLSMGGETFNGTARFLTDRAEHQRAMAAIRKKYWMYRPIIALGQVLGSDARQDGSVRGRVGGIESNSKAYLKQLEFCSR